MKIDKKLLNEQLEQLDAQRTQVTADLNAVLGGIQVCQHLLTVLDMEEPKKEKVHELKDLLPKGKKKGKR